MPRQLKVNRCLTRDMRVNSETRDQDSAQVMNEGDFEDWEPEVLKERSLPSAGIEWTTRTEDDPDCESERIVRRLQFAR